MFCKNCAEVLTDTDVTCPRCGFAAGTGMKYCATCGEEVPVGAAVCEMCGCAVSNASAGYPQQQAQAAYQQQPTQPMRQEQQSFNQQPYNQQPYDQQYYSQPPYNQQPYAQQRFDPLANGVYANGEQKSKVAAGLLGIFLGSLGIHNFYLGYTGKAIAQLLISVCSCGTLALVSEIWGLVEGIQILTGSINTDAKGIPLKD